MVKFTFPWRLNWILFIKEKINALSRGSFNDVDAFSLWGIFVWVIGWGEEASLRFFHPGSTLPSRLYSWIVFHCFLLCCPRQPKHEKTCNNVKEPVPMYHVYSFHKWLSQLIPFRSEYFQKKRWIFAIQKTKNHSKCANRALDSLHYKLINDDGDSSRDPQLQYAWVSYKTRKKDANASIQTFPKPSGAFGDGLIGPSLAFPDRSTFPESPRKD